MTRRPAPRESSRCHYCDGAGGTRDHIVPRSRALFLGSNARDNIVMACARCNGLKGDQRSDCPCMKCLRAWTKYGPPGWHLWPVRAVSQTFARVL
jgi:5-methylcytosine-specific restriction endonuclease McrA